MNTVWTEEEKDFVRQNANILTDKQGSEQLSRITGRNVTLNSWRKQRQKLGISKMPGRGICEVRKQNEDS
jgi:hypothetical protein|tara:strand:+ start:23 stop:232 length:210 start_codon:yes stop_codon:yes gene_type:complete